MQLSVKGKQLDVGEALRSHIASELPILVGKYFDNPVDATVTLSREAQEFRTDIIVHVGTGILVRSHASASDARSAFAAAAEHIGKRLRRYKRRLRDHRQNRENLEILPAQQYVLEAESDRDDLEGDDGPEPDQPVVVAEMQTAIEVMTVGEAVMRLDLANLPALMFRNGAHGGLNMVYRRSDGNIGWVDPRGSRTSGKPS